MRSRGAGRTWRICTRSPHAHALPPCLPPAAAAPGTRTTTHSRQSSGGGGLSATPRGRAEPWARSQRATISNAPLSACCLRESREIFRQPPPQQPPQVSAPHLTLPYLPLPYQVSGLSSTCGAAGCQAPTRAREPNPPQHPTPPLSSPLRTPHPPSSTPSPRPTAAWSKCSPFPNRSPGSRTSSPSTTGTAASEPPRGREATSCPSCRRTSSRRWSGTAARGPRVVAA